MKRTKKLLNISTILILLLSFIPNVQVQAADISFTVTPSYVNPTDVSKTISVQAASGTFTPGSSHPVLIKKGTNETNAIEVNLLDSTDEQVNMTIPPNLSEGTYAIRIGDPNGQSVDGDGYSYYDVGDIEIRSGIITSSVPLQSLPNKYDSKPSITLTAKYANLTIEQTKVNILDANNTVVDTPNITNISTIDPYTKDLTFSLSTGLESGTYDVEVVTGDKTIVKNNAIVVRGTPSISLPTNFSLNEGYSQKELVVTGQNTGFNNTTTVSVLQNGEVQSVINGSPTIVDTNKLKVNVNSGLTAGTYDLLVKTGVEEASTSFQVKQAQADLKKAQEDVQVTKIGQSNGSINLRIVGNTTTNFDQSTLDRLKVLDSSDNEVTGKISNKSLTGQEITFTLSRDITPGTYKFSVYSGTKEIQKSFTIVEPSISEFVLNTGLNMNGDLPEGYVDHTVQVTGGHTDFNDATTVSVQGQTSQTESVKVQDKTSLEFTLKSGLPSGTHTIEIDMDGDSNTTTDQLTHDVSVLSPSFGSVSPSTVVNTSDQNVTLTVTGMNTNFTYTQNLNVLITDGSGNQAGNISNVTASDDNTLTFDLVPSSISNPGLYNVKVNVNESGFQQSIEKQQALTVDNKGINKLSRTEIYQDELAGSPSITLTGDSTSFTNIQDLLIDGTTVDSAQYNVSTDTELALTLSDSLSEGSHTIRIEESSGDQYETSFLVKPERTINDVSKSAFEFDYATQDIIVTGQSINFALSGNLPELSISGPEQHTLSAQSTSDNNKFKFSLPSGWSKGTYNISAEWKSGTHSGLTLPVGTIDITNKYQSLYVKKDSAETSNVIVNEDDLSFTLQAYGVLKVDVNQHDLLTNKVTWNITSGSDVVSINQNGQVTILKDGTATIEASFDGQTTSVNVTVNNVEEETNNAGSGSPSPSPSPSPAPTSGSDEEDETSDSNSVEFDVKEEKLPNGKVRNTITIDDNASDMIEEAMNNKQKELKLDFTSNEADELAISLNKDTVEKLSNGKMGLQLQSKKGSIKLSEKTLNQFGEDISINLSEVSSSEAASIEQDLESDQKVNVKQRGETIRVEADYKGQTEVTIPLGDLDITSDQKNLGVYIVHSDGDRELVSGKISYNEEGEATGVTVHTEKFSTFTVVELDQEREFFKWNTRFDVEEDKVWEVNFNTKLHPATVTADYVYVMDSTGEKVPTNVSLVDGNMIKVEPLKDYHSGETYQLVITNDVKSLVHKQMIEPVHMIFEVK
ncbi:Ig-like domain-containing protein [Pontibacillus marinus]|uniref:SbsA Ig-like domain-containing protein n=1 Tax=Pontibacillus marinus BH030004 = DSM 16465 TaxID=1385511 RepID=A0A0A5GCW2_9BACI|nr:Ig-like domain-containing protein [Pontibacillus marinus]KGX91036.1 hypothetical protein N783_13440 [Pontibacillus marinus BH030004 = DSM 16465]